MVRLGQRGRGRLDTQEWLGPQAWCAGIGTIGSSYDGCTQWLAAPGGSRHLKGMVPAVCPSDRPTSCARVFFAGHRLRLDLSSSNFPRIDRNPNTGGPIGFETEWRVAQQRIHNSAARPSRLRLPVIPRE